MSSSTQGHGQAPTADTPSGDPTSDVEIIEIGDSPVKLARPPKPLHQKRKPFANQKAELQMAPMFSQIAAASSSTTTATPLKRKRFPTDETDNLAPSAVHSINAQSPPSFGPSPVGRGARVDPLKAVQPLAERMRPTSLSHYVGQSSIVGPGSLLGSLLDNITEAVSEAEKKGQSAQKMSHEISSSLGSMIFCGPPGSGKTTLARLIARKIEADFKELSATSSGAADVRKVFDQAKNQLRLTGRRTVLFIDEIHRFTKPQQDLFLPFVENGWVTLIGATTENPSFKVNGALLSRSTHSSVFTLEKHSVAELEQILRNAVSALPPPVPRIPSTLIPFIADVSDGDARQALNSLELALSVCKKREAEEKQNAAVNNAGNEDTSAKPQVSNVKDSEETDDDRLLMTAIKKGLRKGYDRTGEERYDMISAMHKSIRGSDGSAALYWLARMLEGGEDPIYVARRLIVVASEDVGLADLQGLPLHCVAYLSEAKKSTRSYEAYNKAVALANETPLPGVPLQIRNAPTTLMKQLGYGKDYSYNPGFAHPVHNEYLPSTLAESSTFGSDSLLHTEEQYRSNLGKEWNESRLRDWELMRNKGQDWEGRSGR
ncbi:hypothetical protein QFC21_001921 [Naganishia friedmannii]|uniref:Uncharacterized protein n=1 Tax=Naganishia friedmannii TaxID=89922 RepID=A0ACC2W0P5_9TREE|nr:hypothetical protein QFC21_001921 [Naganishia friedmannii]